MKFLVVVTSPSIYQRLTNGQQIYEITTNLLAVEYPHVFKQQAKSKCSETTINYKAVIEGITTHLSHLRRYNTSKGIFARPCISPGNSRFASFPVG